MLPARWLNDKKLVVDGGGRIDWPKLRIDKTVFYVGDFAFGTYAEQGDAMELCEVLEVFDTGKGSAANRPLMMRVRWFWRPLQLEELGYQPDLTEYATSTRLVRSHLRYTTHTLSPPSPLVQQHHHQQLPCS